MCNGVRMSRSVWNRRCERTGLKKRTGGTKSLWRSPAERSASACYASRSWQKWPRQKRRRKQKRKKWTNNFFLVQLSRLILKLFDNVQYISIQTVTCYILIFNPSVPTQRQTLGSGYPTFKCDSFHIIIQGFWCKIEKCEKCNMHAFDCPLSRIYLLLPLISISSGNWKFTAFKW